MAQCINDKMARKPAAQPLSAKPQP
jgi:hypothetical protein